MALETVLLALGPNDADRIDDLTDTVSDIAGPAGARVVLVHVFTDDEFAEATDRLEFESPGEADVDDVAKRHATVRDIGDRLREAGIGFNVRGHVGDHGEGIVEMAGEEEADLVVVGGRKRTPTGKAVFGSTAQHVMLESPAPVTFVRGT
jgi:nucleotide-binding universal stress UspA family protein